MDDEMRPIKVSKRDIELGKDLIRDLKSDWTSINPFSLREEENANSKKIMKPVYKGGRRLMKGFNWTTFIIGLIIIDIVVIISVVLFAIFWR